MSSVTIKGPTLKALRATARRIEQPPELTKLFTKTDNVKLRIYGEMYIHHGFRTRRYRMQALVKLFAVRVDTITDWLKNGLLPQPAIILENGPFKTYFWMYHQIQPFYSWLMELRRAGYKHIHHARLPEQVANLRRRIKLAERLYQRHANIEEPYVTQAGQYGVIWVD